MNKFITIVERNADNVDVNTDNNIIYKCQHLGFIFHDKSYDVWFPDLKLFLLLLYKIGPQFVTRSPLVCMLLPTATIL